MRALAFNRVGTVELDDVPEPRPAEGEVTVSVAYAGICGSDLHGIAPGGYRTPPLVMGHEVAGTTPDGRRVAVNATLGCGGCDLCGLGREHLCRDRQIVGIHRPGGFAEALAVPQDALVELPDSVPLERGAMVEPLAVALRAFRRSRARADDRVAVIGAGNIGLLVLAVARHYGAQVDVTDRLADRLETARRYGAARTLGALEDEYDVVFDAVGTREAHAESVARLRPGGTAVWIGTRDPEPAFDALELVRVERSVLASFTYTRQEFADAARLSAHLELGWYQVHPLEQGAQLFMDLAGGGSTLPKVLLRP